MRLSTSPRRVAEPGTAAAEKPYFPLIRWDICQLAAERQRGALPAASAFRTSPGCREQSWPRSRAAGLGFAWGLTGCTGNHQRRRLRCQMACNGERSGEEQSWLKKGIYQNGEDLSYVMHRPSDGWWVPPRVMAVYFGRGPGNAIRMQGCGTGAPSWGHHGSGLGRSGPCKVFGRFAQPSPT